MSTSKRLAGAGDTVIAAQSSADAVGTAVTVRATRPIPRLGDDIYVQCEFVTAGATVAVTVLLYDDVDETTGLGIGDSTTGKFVGVALPGTQTATAGSYRTGTGAAGSYRAPVLIFVGGNASAYEVRIAATSSGNVVVRAWTTA